MTSERFSYPNTARHRGLTLEFCLKRIEELDWEIENAADNWRWRRRREDRAWFAAQLPWLQQFDRPRPLTPAYPTPK
jgi:hypothetical protein